MHRKTPFVLIALILSVFLSLASHAQTAATHPDPAKEAKVEELFKLMHLEETYGQLMTQMLSQSHQTVSGLFPELSALTPAQKKEFADFESKVEALVKDNFSWNAMKPEYVKLYADTYTYEDLDGIIIFYESSVGQKMLSSTPALMKQSSTIAMNHMEEVQPKMRQMIEDFQKQLQAEQANPK